MKASIYNSLLTRIHYYYTRKTAIDQPKTKKDQETGAKERERCSEERWRGGGAKLEREAWREEEREREGERKGTRGHE